MVETIGQKLSGYNYMLFKDMHLNIFKLYNLNYIF